MSILLASTFVGKDHWTVESIQFEPVRVTRNGVLIDGVVWDHQTLWDDVPRELTLALRQAIQNEEEGIPKGPVTSFDFDRTLWDEDANDFIWETVALLRQHIVKGERVVVVTSREPRWIQECHDLLAKLSISLEVFSAPANAFDMPCGPNAMNWPTTRMCKSFAPLEKLGFKCYFRPQPRQQS